MAELSLRQLISALERVAKEAEYDDIPVRVAVNCREYEEAIEFVDLLITRQIVLLSDDRWSRAGYRDDIRP